MSTQEERVHINNRLDTGSHDNQEPKPYAHKERWLQKYTARILAVWSQWQTPLGVARAYTNKIRTDLVRFYDDPLKKLFIEATYEPCWIRLSASHHADGRR